MQYGKEYTLHLGATLINTHRIQQEVFFEVGKLEVDGNLVGSIHITPSGSGPSVKSERTIKVICRGESHIRVLLREVSNITGIDVNDRYID